MIFLLSIYLAGLPGIITIENSFDRLQFQDFPSNTCDVHFLLNLRYDDNPINNLSFYALSFKYLAIILR